MSYNYDFCTACICAAAVIVAITAACWSYSTRELQADTERAKTCLAQPGRVWILVPRGERGSYQCEAAK